MLSINLLKKNKWISKTISGCLKKMYSIIFKSLDPEKNYNKNPDPQPGALTLEIAMLKTLFTFSLPMMYFQIQCWKKNVYCLSKKS